jgi:heptosyltransferase III
MGRILFIRGGAMGDFLLTLPTLALLRRELPQNEVHVLGYPSLAQLAVEAGWANEVRALEHAALSRFFVPQVELDESWVAYFASFDVVISYLYDENGHWAANLRRAGVRTLFIGPHKPTEAGPHAARQLAQPLESLALFLEKDYVTWPGSSAASRRGVALHFGSGSVRKNWGLDAWCRLLLKMRDEGFLTAPLLLISGEAEASLLAEMEQWLTQQGIAYESAAHWPLGQLRAALSERALFLGHDTGPAHLAAVAGTPSILIFGPTEPAVWAPAAPWVSVLRDPSGLMPRVSIEAVLEKVREIFPKSP